MRTSKAFFVSCFETRTFVIVSLWKEGNISFALNYLRVYYVSNNQRGKTSGGQVSKHMRKEELFVAEN